MAQAGPSSLVDKISEHVTCLVCLNTFDYPKCLPCQHTFCYRCLQSYVEKQHSIVSFPCPLCRAVTQIPPGGMEAFPTNFNLRNIVDELESLEIKPICQGCESNDKPGKPAVSHCAECEENLCGECVDAHTRVKFTRHHKLTPLKAECVNAHARVKFIRHHKLTHLKAASETPKKEKLSEMLTYCEKTNPTQNAWTCDKHEKQSILFYCETCSTPLCGACMSNLIGQGTQEHSNHSVVGLDVAHNNAKSKLTEQLNELSSILNQENEDEKQREIEQIDEVFMDAHSTLLSDIEERRQAAHEHIDAWAVRMTDQAQDVQGGVDERFQEFQRKLHDTYSEARAQRQNIALGLVAPCNDFFLNKDDSAVKLSDIRAQVEHVYNEELQLEKLSLQNTNNDEELRDSLIEVLGDLDIEHGSHEPEAEVEEDDMCDQQSESTCQDDGSSAYDDQDFYGSVQNLSAQECHLNQQNSDIVLSKNDVALSKKLAFLLRHKAEKQGFTFLDGGYLNVRRILERREFKNYTESDVIRVVQGSEMQRFHLREEGGNLQIRAVRGHTVKVKNMDLRTVAMGEVSHCVYGTTWKSWSTIRTEGINKMDRTHIQFAAVDPWVVDKAAGIRPRSRVLIYIDINKAINDGIKFVFSTRDIILSEGDSMGRIPPDYFLRALDKKNGHDLWGY